MDIYGKTVNMAVLIVINWVTVEMKFTCLYPNVLSVMQAILHFYKVKIAFAVSFNVACSKLLE